MPQVREVKSEEEDVGKVVVEELEAEMAEVEDLRTAFEVEIPEEGEDHRKVFEAAEAGELMTDLGVEAEKVAEVTEVEAPKAGLAIKNPPKKPPKKPLKMGFLGFFILFLFFMKILQTFLFETDFFMNK
jgi:hypothetical protein